MKIVISKEKGQKGFDLNFDGGNEEIMRSLAEVYISVGGILGKKKTEILCEFGKTLTSIGEVYINEQKEKE